MCFQLSTVHMEERDANLDLHKQRCGRVILVKKVCIEYSYSIANHFVIYTPLKEIMDNPGTPRSFPLGQVNTYNASEKPHVS